eukprot:scaffold1738_cov73-Phaeocystis_antarctica.AAC.4
MSPLALAALACCAGSLLPPPSCSLPGAEAPQCKISYHQDAAWYTRPHSSLPVLLTSCRTRARPPTKAKVQPGRDTESHAPTPRPSKPQLHTLPG